MASVRDAFFNRIYELVKGGEDICILTSDLGAPSLDDFRRDFPERYISVGIAEQNMVAVAAGLAFGGKKVVAYGLNPFPVTRAFDQIRCLLGERSAPVTLCALNAGLCSAESGYTHMPVEDVAIMRTLSNIRVFNPTDETVSQELADETLSLQSPRFIRFDKAVGGVLYGKGVIDMRQGFSVLGKHGRAKVGIVTNGICTREIDGWLTEAAGMDEIKLLDMFSMPVDEDALVSELGMCEKLLTVEENVLAGGIGSYILEIMSDHGLAKCVKRLGLDGGRIHYDVFTDREFVRKDQRIDMGSIQDSVRGLLA